MSKRLRYFLLIILIFPALMLSAQDDAPTENPFMEMLALVPNAPASRAGELYFNDRTAIVEAYPDALMPENWAEFDAVRAADELESDSDDFARLLWWRVFMNTSSSQLVRYFALAGEMPEVVGFDFFDVEREVFYGVPPETGQILAGDFDEDRVREAYSALDLEQVSTEGVELWCSVEGCDAGTQFNAEEINPANPFGGDLGRRQPMVIGDGYLMSSPSEVMVQSHILTHGGDMLSLADVPEYVAGVEAISQYGPLVQAMIIDGGTLMSIREETSLITAMMQPGATQESIQAAIRAQLENYQDLPVYNLLLLGDTVTANKHIGLVALVYSTVEDAEIAAEILPQRIENYESLRVRQPLVNVLESRYIDGVETTIYESDNGNAVLVLEFATLKGTAEQIIESTTISITSDLELSFPGAAYRLLYESLISRDMGWLTTVPREQLEGLLDD